MTVGHRPRVGRAFRRIALLGATALLFALLPGGVAFAEHFENTQVLDADNAVEAGVNWSKFTFDSATDVALGRNDKFPDNLASSVIQGTDTPLLYTDGASLSEETRDELERLGAETIHVLGGEAAIAEVVVDELEALGYETHRDAGETRIETALDIAATHAADATHGLVVRAFGDDQGDETRAWADALAAGGWAAEEGWPVFLTQTLELNDNVRAYLEDSAIESLTIIGGVSAVSAAVQAELEAMGIDVDRVSGSNRFATAVAIAAARGFADAGDATEVILAEGQQSDAWAGGFAAAAYSAISGAPIVLSNGANIPPETEEFLEGAGADGSVALVCGPFVEPAACAEAAQMLGHEHAAHTNQTFTASPASGTSQNRQFGTSLTDSSSSVTYTFTGVTGAVRIALFPCTGPNAPTTTGESTSFRAPGGSNPTAGTAQGEGTTDTGVARITSVNGTPVAPATEVGPVTSNNGTVTFTINSNGQDCVVPVVYSDTDGDTNLDVGSNGQPTEPFGVGGRTVYTPAEAAGGAFNVNVDSVDKTSDFFVGCGSAGNVNGNPPLIGGSAAGAGTCGLFDYDANDTFQINGVPQAAGQTGMAAFEAALSAGDTVSGTYAPDPAASSTFNLNDAAPLAPSNVVATPASATTVTVTWDDSATPTVDAYRVYRAQTANTSTACTTGATQPSSSSNLPSGYTLVHTVADKSGTSNADGSYTVTDTVQANTRYCYIVRSVDDGDESPNSGVGGTTPAQATTGTVVSSQGPRSTDALLVNDSSNPGIVSGGDAYRFIFDEQLRPVDPGDTFVLTEDGAQGDALDIVCDTLADGATPAGENALCGVNTTNTTIAGTTYGPGRVLDVTIKGVAIVTPTRPGTTTNNTVSYPATVTAQAGFVDVDGNQWDLPGSPDRTVDAEAGNLNSGTATPATDPNTAAPGAGPDMVSANRVTGTTTQIDVIYDEQVVPYGGTYDASQFTYDTDCAGAGTVQTATSVIQQANNTLRVTFAGPIADDGGALLECIIYTDNIPAYQDAGDVVDTVGNQATSPDTENLTFP